MKLSPTHTLFFLVCTTIVVTSTHGQGGGGGGCVEFFEYAVGGTYGGGYEFGGADIAAGQSNIPFFFDNPLDMEDVNAELPAGRVIADFTPVFGTESTADFSAVGDWNFQFFNDDGSGNNADDDWIITRYGFGPVVGRLGIILGSTIGKFKNGGNVDPEILNLDPLVIKFTACP